MKTALIINDTRDHYHYGCFATSTMLHTLLRQDGYSIDTIAVGRPGSISPSPERVEQLTCRSFFQSFSAENPDILAQIEAAEIVVFNGEGTLHGFSHRPRNLLYLISVAKHFSAKPTYLVNHSLFPTDFQSETDPQAFEFYKAAVRPLDGIASREIRSQSVYAEMGVPSAQAFDLLPLYARSQGIAPDDEGRDENLVVVGVGVGWTPAHALALARALKACLPATKRIQFLNGAPVRDPSEEAAYPSLMRSVDERIEATFSMDKPIFSPNEGAKEWIRTISRAGLLVTGRYHHVVAALAMGTPTIAFTSNTDKIESTFQLLGLGAPTINPREAGFEERIREALSAAHRSDAHVIRTTKLQQTRVCDLAYANRIWPHASCFR